MATEVFAPISEELRIIHEYFEGQNGFDQDAELLRQEPIGVQRQLLRQFLTPYLKTAPGF